MLFVGRVVSYKNPSFVVEILEHLLETRKDVVAVFAGAGNQEEEILEMARRKTLESRVRLIGFRDDVPELMANSDVLIWPSLEEPKEGLGLGIVEAQAAGLPILMSHSVPAEAIVVPELTRRLPLNTGAKVWAAAIAEVLQSEYPWWKNSLAKVESSSFSLAQGVSNLMRLYLS